MGTENVNTTMKGNVLNLLKDEFLAKKTKKTKKKTHACLHPLIHIFQAHAAQLQLLFKSRLQRM